MFVCQGIAIGYLWYPSDGVLCLCLFVSAVPSDISGILLMEFMFMFVCQGIAIGYLRYPSDGVLCLCLFVSAVPSDMSGILLLERQVCVRLSVQCHLIW